MKRTLIALALVALVIAPSAMAKRPDNPGSNGNGKGNKPNKPGQNKPEKPQKVCLKTEGWVMLADDGLERVMLELNAENEGKAIAADKGCIHRKTTLQASCSKPGPVPPGVIIYQYRAKEQYRCPGEKRTRNAFFARTYTPPIPTPVV